MSAVRWAASAGAGLILAACTAATGQQVPSGPPGQCPAGVPSTIDRVDFVFFDGIMYQGQRAGLGRPLTDQDLSVPLERVRCMLSDLKFDASYNELRNGNAAFLAPGTVVYTLAGYAPSFRLAAHRDGGLVVYEADFNPTARHGRDLLDLAGKVSSISVDSDTGDGTTPIGTIGDRSEVERLTGMLLAAPVDQRSQAGHAGARYFLLFHLTDGTAVIRAYFRGSGEVSRGILTPPAFRSAIEQAARVS